MIIIIFLIIIFSPINSYAQFAGGAFGNNVGNGWQKNGTVVSVVATTDTVGFGSTSPRGKVDINSGTGFGSVVVDGSSGACFMLRDTDNLGWTECKVLNGTMSCSIDADGVCD